VRNPLTNINLAADQLNSEITNKDENTAFLFNMIDRNSNRINQLIADLLNSTKIPDLNMEKIRAGELLDETLRQAEDRIRLKRARVIKEYDDLAVIQVDRHKMKIALLNIIINALEAMEQQEDIVLELSTARVADRCRITISDRGPGMDEEALSRIFEPYFTSKAKGNGLGLTNTQNIILNHNGEITVESTLGKGTSFSIFFNAA
jgi:signal transduction histidine kinase